MRANVHNHSTLTTEDDVFGLLHEDFVLLSLFEPNLDPSPTQSQTDTDNFNETQFPSFFEPDLSLTGIYMNHFEYFDKRIF